jgi:hypothetical protein
MRPDEIKLAADNFDMPVKTAIKTRIAYLLNLINRWCAYIDELTDEIPASDTMAIIGELIAIRNYQDRLKKGVVLKSITDEMIQQAKEVPIESVVTFVRGKATAWCHPDKNPSLSHDRKRNKAYCFPCSKSFDTISALQERDGLTFIEAVRHLYNNHAMAV